MGDKDDLLPKKASGKAKASSKPPAGGGAGPSARMVRVMRGTRVAGVLLGGLVTLVGAMALVGLVTDVFWVRLLVAILVVVGLPMFVADRFFARANAGRGLSATVDVFAIILLGVALVIVAADFASRPLLVREGDRYARSGSRAMARVVYFLGGVSFVFPDEKGSAPVASGAASASASAAPSSSK